VFVVGGQLFGAADLVRGGPSPIDESVNVASSASVGPAITGFRPVYSRSLQRLFLVGGEDAAGTPVGTVRWSTLDSDVWQTVPQSEYAVGTVLAATYDYADGMLWILDEVAETEQSHGGTHHGKGHHGKMLARLTRLDPDTGRAEVLGEWPRARHYDQLWLRTDRDGAMLLFASSAKHHHHAVARLAASAGALKLLGFRVRPRALIHPPVVDMAGYWLIARKGKSGIDVQRLEELPLHSKGWSGHVGQCL
jgi:hypothetical protein